MIIVRPLVRTTVPVYRFRHRYRYCTLYRCQTLPRTGASTRAPAHRAAPQIRHLRLSSLATSMCPALYASDAHLLPLEAFAQWRLSMMIAPRSAT